MPSVLLPGQVKSSKLMLKACLDLREGRVCKTCKPRTAGLMWKPAKQVCAQCLASKTSAAAQLSFPRQVQLCPANATLFSTQSWPFHQASVIIYIGFNFLVIACTSQLAHHTLSMTTHPPTRILTLPARLWQTLLQVSGI